MIQNQKSHATGYNRYPEIFKEISHIIQHPKQILSFGCSTGIECNTLKEIYFPNTKIIGLDINEHVINENKKNNKYKNIEYFNDVEKIKKSDLIFAMSVLCSWPESEGKYTFDIFLDTINLIDNLLEKDGYLCIYNSKYLFTETQIFKDKYEIIETKYKDTGFVYKYHSNNEKIKDNYPYFLFKKLNN